MEMAVASTAARARSKKTLRGKTMKYYFLLCLTLIGSIPMASETYATKTQTPIYYLKFTVHQAAIEVRLNDIPVLTNDSEGNLSSEKPVPESVIDGKNTLTVKIRPLDPESTIFSHQSYADVTLVAREKNASLDQGTALLHLRVTAEEDKEVVLDGTEPRQGSYQARVIKHDSEEIVAERSTKIDSPYPRWAWQDGVQIEETEDNFLSLLEEYKNIYEVLASEDMSRIKNLYSHAAREFAIAYHYDDLDSGHRIVNTGGLVGDDEWVLGNIHTLIDNDYPLKLDVYADGKLARIVDADDGEDAVIVYLHKEVEMISIQKFGFYKTEAGQWVMIR